MQVRASQGTGAPVSALAALTNGLGQRVREAVRGRELGGIECDRQRPPVGRQHPARSGLDLHLGPLSPLLEPDVLNVGERYAYKRASGLEDLNDLAVEDNPRV